MGADGKIARARATWAALPPRFVAISGITFLSWLGSSIIAPTLPLYAERLGVSAAGVGVAVGAFFLGRMVLSVGSATLTEAWGLRSVAAVGCLVSAVGSAAAGYADSFVLLVAARVLQGAGAGLYATAALSVIVALSPPDRVGRLVSLYQGLGFAGFSLGPVIGGAVGVAFGLRAPFLVFSALSVLGAVVALVRLPAGLRPRALGPADDVAGDASEPGARPGLGRLLRTRAFLVALLATFVVFAMRGGMRNSVVPLFGESQLGMSELAIGVMLAVASVFNIAVLGHAGRALDRGRRPVVAWSLFATGASVAAIAVVWQPWLLVVVMVVLASATGYGSVAPTTVTADVAPVAIRTTAIGVQRAVTDLGHMLGPALAGLAADQLGFRPAFAVVGALVAATAIAAITMPETLRRPSGVPASTVPEPTRSRT